MRCSKGLYYSDLELDAISRNPVYWISRDAILFYKFFFKEVEVKFGVENML